MDTITLTGIEIFAHGGVSEEERAVGQRYRLNITLELDLGPAGRSDAIEDTVHYGRVYEVAVRTARERPFKLIESVAARIADQILTQFPVHAVTVDVQKLLPPIDGVVAQAGVAVRRER